jgi:hypothetical protein
MNLISRLSDHKSSAKKFDISIVRMIFTECVDKHSFLEKGLLKFASSICREVNANEYFIGINLYDIESYLMNNGISFARSYSIPKLSEDGLLVVTMDQSFSMNKKSITRQFTEITDRRVINLFRKRKCELQPSVVVQVCKSSRLGISRDEILSSIKKLTEVGFLRESIVKHGKTGIESKRYSLTRIDV